MNFVTIHGFVSRSKLGVPGGHEAFLLLASFMNSRIHEFMSHAVCFLLLTIHEFGVTQQEAHSFESMNFVTIHGLGHAARSPQFLILELLDDPWIWTRSLRLENST